MIKASPIKACNDLDNEDRLKGHIVIMERGDCMFIEKVILIIIIF